MSLATALHDGLPTTRHALSEGSITVTSAGIIADTVSKLPETLTFADLSLDPVTRDVYRGERQISLTRTEFALLEMLMANPRRVLSRSRILEEVWGYDFPTSGNALEVYVGYLRRKTEADGESRLVHTVRGVGYVVRPS